MCHSATLRLTQYFKSNVRMFSFYFVVIKSVLTTFFFTEIGLMALYYVRMKGIWMTISMYLEQTPFEIAKLTHFRLIELFRHIYWKTWFFKFRGVSQCQFQIFWKKNGWDICNSEDPHQMPHCAVSNLGLLWLPMSCFGFPTSDGLNEVGCEVLQGMVGLKRNLQM